MKLLEHNKFERKFQQLTLPMDMEIKISEDDPVRLASAQLEELDYRELYRAYCANCQHRTECCKAKNDVPKEIKVSTEFLRLSQQSQENIMTPQGILLRINRSIQVEGAFGVLKSDRKFKRFLMRDRTNISTELYLDLKKLWSRYNIERLNAHLFSLQKE